MAYKESTVDYSGSARAALQFTVNALPLGAGDRAGDYVSSFGVLIPALVATRGFQAFAGTMDRMGKSNVTELDTVQNAAFAAQKWGCGNCWEHAAVAYMFLRRSGIRPIALIGRTNHAFVMIGNDMRTAFDDPSSFPRNSWICDAWGKQVYPARQYLAHESERAAPVLVEMD